MEGLDFRPEKKVYLTKECISRFGFKLKNIIYVFSRKRRRYQFKYTFRSGRISKPSIFNYKFNLTYQVLVFCIKYLRTILIPKNVKLALPLFCIL